LEKNKAPKETEFGTLIKELIEAGVLDDNEDNKNLTKDDGDKCGEGVFEVNDGHIVWEKSNMTDPEK
ncbi:MAG: hypothetical protein RBR24_08655, partial [Candidatus Carbobacillus sp.]|nr:hypothetical protein [Candidatus Carbobacillus sp.]